MEGEIKTMISTVLTSHHVTIMIQNLNTLLLTKIPSAAISALVGCHQHSMRVVGSEDWMVGLSSWKAAKGG